MIQGRPPAIRMIRLSTAVLALTGLVAGCGGSNPLPTASGKSSRAVGLVVKTKHKSRHTAQHQYAVQILPVLDRSVALFDRTVSAVTGTQGSDNLDAVCGQYGTSVNILSTYFDNVPHPWPWYTTLGYLHHSTMDVYGYMMGALQSCQTASSSGDTEAAATAMSDMALAARKMHDTDNHVRQLVHQP